MRALVVSYVFPPTGGAGVARPLKLVKYLGGYGVTPAVLTVKNPSVPVIDRSLGSEVPAGTEVVLARTFEPGYEMKKTGWSVGAERARDPGWRRRLAGAALAVAKQALVPDPQVLWQPAAQLALARRLARGRDDVVWISGPPFSQFLLAALCRLRPGVAVVLDYRDEWSTVREAYEMKGRLPARVGGLLEKVLLRTAHAVTIATDAFRDNLLRRFPFVDPARVHTIPNGFDPADYPADLQGPPPDAARFVLTYAGTVFRLTSARGLLGAVRRLHAAEPELARLLRLRFLGRIVDTELGAFDGTEALGVERVGYVPHADMVRDLGASHMLLSILDDAPHVDRIYPAKIFEIAHLAQRFGRPCLTLAPPGVLADLVTLHRIGVLLPPRDEPRIAAFLAEQLEAFRSGHPSVQPEPVDIERYDRARLAGQFAEVFREAVARARRSAR